MDGYKFSTQCKYLIDSVGAPVDECMPMSWRGGPPDVRDRVQLGFVSGLFVRVFRVGFQVGEVVPSVQDGLLAEVVEAVL